MKLLDKIRMHSDKVKEWGSFALKEAAPALLTATGLLCGAALLAGSPAVAAALAPVAVATLASSLAGPLMSVFGSLGKIPKADPNKISTEKICQYADFASKAGPSAVQNFLKEVTSRMTPERLQSFEKDMAKAAGLTTVGAAMQTTAVNYLSVKPEFQQLLHSATEARHNMSIQVQAPTRSLAM